MSSAGIILDDDDVEDHSDEVTPEINVEEITQNPIERMTVKELNSQLKDAIENEDYELASRLRDEINKRKKIKYFFIKKLVVSCMLILYLIALNQLNNNYWGLGN